MIRKLLPFIFAAALTALAVANALAADGDGIIWGS